MMPVYPDPTDPMYPYGKEFLCPFCDHGVSSCQAQNEDKGYGCTRGEDHRGPHAACGTGKSSHPIKVWGD